MGLQEGISCFSGKVFGEKGILRVQGKNQKEIQRGGFRIIKNAKPFLFVPEKELLPFVKLILGNAETLTDTFQG